MHAWLGTQSTIYVSSYYDICVLILRAEMHAWLGTQTTIYVSSYYDICVLYYDMCVLILRAAWRERRQGGDEWVAMLYRYVGM